MTNTKSFALGTLFLAVLSPLSAADSMPKRVVVVAVPAHVKFIESASGELPNGNLIIASKYSVVLERVRKIAGDGAVPKRLRVTLFAPHKGSISSEALISVVLEVADGKFEARYWNVVRQVTCLPRELIQDESPARDVYGSVVGDEKCLKFESPR